MSKLEKIEGGFAFYCPGCKCHHYFDSRWDFDGNMDAPTFSPSLLVGPYWRMPKGWDYDKAPRDENGVLLLHADGIHTLGAFEMRCHSFIRRGTIQYLSDCTHELAGQTVPMAENE